MYICIIVTIFITAFLCKISYDYELFKKSPNYVMSFKESLDLANLPIVTMYQGNNKIHFLLDTGSTDNMIDSNYTTLNYKNIENEGANLTGIGGTQQTELIELNLFYKDKEFVVDALKLDMSNTFGVIKQNTGIQLHGILGSSFFNKYKYILDYYNMIAYPKK